MDIQIFMPYWGSEALPILSFLEKAKQAGYDGVEVLIPEEDEVFGNELKKGLEKFDLKLIGHQYLIPHKETPKQYGDRMEKLLSHLASFNPVLIDSHTGRDFFDFESNCKLIERAEEVGNAHNVPIMHETHRGRFNFSTVSTKPFFDKYPDLKITADFSHWVCVSESYLEDQPEVMKEAIKRAGHIHARVGHMEGPQVTHPGAPEWKEALEVHTTWWDTIIEHNKKQGKEYFTITTEFGTIPYLPTLPYTNQPVVSQWEVNVWMKDYLRERYNQ